VVNVVPGSASARQGELEVNDKIIKVAQGSEEPVDVVDMRIDDVLPMIRGSKGTEVRLTVKKTSGEVKVIPIIRDVVILEDSYAKSAIIENSKLGVKVGLIDLRSFYADFDDPRGRRCSKDVKEEVEKLMDENIDGIVIDLRFNGGGSLQDVVDMAGIFIEKGPIVQVKNRDNKPFVYEDRDETVLYKGPLVILVNSFSASASEIMAAALQDYGRAIIVGTAPSTFGKGTVQRFFNLDQIVPAKYTELGELGSVKITIQKFYRINGGSNQLKGVIPDIILPGAYSYMEVG
jgi:carboxyl-terminal processing protease